MTRRSVNPAQTEQAMRMPALLFALAFLLMAGSAKASTSGSDVAPTPPMGWANWNSLGCNYDEGTIRAIADRLVSSGMRDAGYKYLIIQECIVPVGHRAPDGTLLPDAHKFPNGIPALVAYIHAKGLKAGIYTDLGPKTCANYEGSYQHEEQDAQTFASWVLISLKRISATSPQAIQRHNSTRECAMPSHTPAGRCSFTSATGEAN